MGLPPYFSPIRIVSFSRRTILLILLHNQIYPSIPTKMTAAVSSMPGSCHSSQFKGRQNRIMFALIIMYVSLPSQTAALCILRCVLPFILNPPLFVFDLCRLFLCSATHRKRYCWKFYQNPFQVQAASHTQGRVRFWYQLPYAKLEGNFGESGRTEHAAAVVLRHSWNFPLQERGLCRSTAMSDPSCMWTMNQSLTVVSDGRHGMTEHKGSL